MRLETALFLVGALFFIVLLSAIRVWRRARRERQSLERLDALGQLVRDAPPTLHPIIDSNRCIGSASCTRACPQGDNVLGLIQGRGTLIDSIQCIGHGRCAAECPVDAIRLVFGTAERGVELPHLRPGFETNVSGLHITGELGGMGLIVNAVRQAIEGMQHIADVLKSERGRGDAEATDVAIVGAGPAGLACALAAAKHGLEYRLLERERGLGGTVLHYPRRKLVMTSPMDLPLVGKVRARTLYKEEVLELWNRAVREHGIKVETDVEVRELTRGQDGLFHIATSRGLVRARKVMLCIGRRGVARRLEVSGEDGGNVQYSFQDPELYEGRRVLVVGGGDSAVEAACMIAEESSARVTLSYRRATITRSRPENRERLLRLVEAGRITALWESEVREITPDSVGLTVKGEDRVIQNDDVLILVGGQPATDLLQRAGIRMERHFGGEVEEDRAGSTEEVFGKIKAQVRSGGLRDFHRPGHSELPWVGYLMALGSVLLVGGLFLSGGEYYFATPEIREKSEPLAAFAPSGIWGQTLGVLALILMVNNFLYFFRKEFQFLKGAGNIHAWLRLHVFSGLTSAAIVLLHSSLLARNLVAVSMYFAIGIVVFTGLIGRYVFAFVPLDPRGRPLAHGALVSLSERMEKDFGRLYKRFAVSAEVTKVLELGREEVSSILTLVPRLAIGWPLRYVRLRWTIRKASREIDDLGKLRDFKYYAIEVFKLRVQLDYQPHLKRLLGLWRSGHAVLAFFLVFLVTAHVMIVFWVGYRWIF